MPKRFLTYSRTEPARTIIFMVALIVFLSQLFTLTPWYVSPGVERLAGLIPADPSFGQRLMGAVPIMGIAGYGMWSCYSGSYKHMANAAMMLQVLYSLAFFTRLVFTFSAGALTWVPYLIIAVVMATCYLFMRFEGRKAGEL